MQAFATIEIIIVFLLQMIQPLKILVCEENWMRAPQSMGNSKEIIPLWNRATSGFAYEI
jgi:hypothetical protein